MTALILFLKYTFLTCLKYTIPYLKDFTTTKIEALKKYKPATIEIQNGWYSVTILGGLTKQISEINTKNGNK